MVCLGLVFLYEAVQIVIVLLVMDNLLAEWVVEAREGDVIEVGILQGVDSPSVGSYPIG